MAASNYNEMAHATGTDWDSMDPLYRWDTHFPERLSRLHMDELGPSSPSSVVARRNRRQRNRNSARFKTQPITFDEIKEVDEDRADDEAKKELKHQFAAFSRSMDGILPKNLVQKGQTKESIPKTPAGACQAAEASGPSDAEGNKLHPAGDLSLRGSVSSPALEAGASSTNPAAVAGLVVDNLPQFDSARQARRQKRRHKKSISEEPELEKTNDKVENCTWWIEQAISIDYLPCINSTAWMSHLIYHQYLNIYMMMVYIRDRAMRKQAYAYWVFHITNHALSNSLLETKLILGFPRKMRFSTSGLLWSLDKCDVSQWAKW